MILFETKRLQVRELITEDLEGFFLLAADPVAMQYIRPVSTRDQCQEIVEQEISGYQKHPQAGRFAVIEKQSGEYIGNYLVRPSSFMAGTEIGYALLPYGWGKGYATELTQEALHFIFEELQHARVFAITDPRNTGSIKVLVRCGFVQQRNFVDDGKEKCLFDITRLVSPVITDRLTIIPLSYQQLVTYLKAGNLLERELSLTSTERGCSPAIKKTVEKDTLPKMINAAADQTIYYTFWLVIDTASRIIVAELGFKGPPNIKKEVEIGYGTMPGYEGKGYMTEAVKGMMAWAQQRNDIAAVLTSIDKKNVASQRIVQKNNFLLIDEREGMCWFKKNILTTTVE